MIRIGILASGTGSNALNIHRYFEQHDKIEVAGIYSNNPEAGILKSAPEAGIKTHLFSRAEMKDGSLLKQLKNDQVDYVILAGFLWLIPANLIEAYEGKMVNIHPALLPSYGGKGMYGANVHKAVVANAEKESGITIHEVNMEYDKGGILFQAKTEVTEDDTADSLAQKIHQLEYQYFPQIIERWILN